MRSEKNILIPGGSGKQIGLDVFFPEKGEPFPLIVFCHGYKGMKDWGHFNQLGERFAQKGFCFVKFNFSHNGTTPDDPTNFGDLESFGQNNYSKELDDLGCVLDWALSSDAIRFSIDRSRVNLIGHSRGGGIVLLKSGEDSRINKVVSWAAVHDFQSRVQEKERSDWEKEGVTFVLNGRTGQNMPIYRQFYLDLQQNAERLDVEKAVKNTSAELMFIHGTADEAVDVQAARALKTWQPKGRLLEIEGAGHTFGIGHPRAKPAFTDHAESVYNATLSFLETNQ